MTMDTMYTQVLAVKAAQAHLPAWQRLADWAIVARLQCERDGHPRYTDGHCIRCRAYEPASTPLEARPVSYTPIAANPGQRVDRTRPCTICDSYCDGDCGYR